MKTLTQFRDLVGQSSIPGLQRLVSTALKEKCGTKRIIERMLEALQGRYHPENYTKEDINMSILMYELGGSAAVYALNHGHTALPSVDTIRPYRRQCSILPSSRQITAEGILPNIYAMFGNQEGKGGKKMVGHTLSFDEISIEARSCYINETDEITGLCREHVHKLESVEMGSELKVVHDAAQAVRDGVVHMGKEATVGAISAHRRLEYDAKPILVSPTCKKASWKDAVRIIATVLYSWKVSPDGEQKHGPICSVSTDGDATRRAALFFLCMHTVIGFIDPLYAFVGGLLGLNLWVGYCYLTMDFDYKHLFKRKCLYNKLGI